MIIKEINIKDIGIDWGNIWRESGNSGYSPDAESEKLFDEVKEDIFRLCKPVYGYDIFPNDDRTPDAEVIRMDGKVFNAGKTISSFLCEAEDYAVYVATAGMEFENYCRRLNDSGDIIKMFFADLVGSAIAARMESIAVREITEAQKAQGKVVSFSYSPGHCEWPVSDQKILFSLLPPRPCGIELQESGLMIPIKSVSGVVGVGKDLKKRQHSCAICNLTDCFRRHKQHTQL